LMAHFVMEGKPTMSNSDMRTRARVTTDRRPQVQSVALIEDIDTRRIQVKLRYRREAALGGGKENLIIDRSAVTTPGEVVKQLLDAGAALPRDQKQRLALVTAALARTPKKHHQVSARTGWHGRTFLTPGGAYGDAAGTLRFKGGDDQRGALWSKAGSAEAWQQALIEPCRASSYLVFALGAAYAAPLLRPLDEDEGVLFNFFGPSSTGKSLACRVGLSVAGRAGSTDLVTYDLTHRAFEEHCCKHNDGLLVLDEAGRQQGGQELRRDRQREIAFTLAGGVGQTRSRKAGRDPDLVNLTWRVIGLSTGEIPLESHQQSWRRADGERLRQIDVPVPSRERHGIFDRLAKAPDPTSAVALAKQVEDAISENYGAAFEPFIERVVAEQKRYGKRASAIVKKFIDKVGAAHNPWEARFARKFGFVLAGAILAAEADLAPFTTKDAQRAVRRIYHRARKAVFLAEEQADVVLELLRRALESGKRLPRVEGSEKLRKGLHGRAWGFCRVLPGAGEVVALIPDQFERLAGSQPAADAVLTVLQRRRVLVPGRDG
ncbi:hypothetical protein CS379_10510, partial [Methylobacterium frigidaeris]